MRLRAWHAWGVIGVALWLTTSACGGPNSPAGLWDATVAVPALDNFAVPFRFEITVRDGAVAGSFFDGDLRVPSGGGTYRDGKLSLVFPQYGSRIDATLNGDHLKGMYDRGTRGTNYVFNAVRAVARSAPAAPVPSMAGEWRIPLSAEVSKTEKAWRLLIRQQGSDVSGAVMRVDGDTGTLSGRFENGRVVMSHFSGARPTAFEVTPRPDGSLSLLQDGRTRLTALRVTDVRAKDFEPTDPRLHTGVRNASEKFRFAFPDLDGAIVSDADPRFLGKVVIVSVTGSWCPNCHDEAPFLARLYRDYRSKGLEIVALAFEEADQLKNPNRVRGFIKQFGLTYPFLLAGTPEEAPEKIPQAVNLTTFPATFVLGRNGRVQAVHAGYASKATGEFYDTEQRAFLAEIDRLIAEPAPGED